MLPKAQLQAAEQGRENGRNPGCRAGKNGGRLVLQKRFVANQVVRQQRDGAGQEHQNQPGANGGEEVQRRWNPGFRKQTKGAKKDESQRLIQLRPPQPS